MICIFLPYICIAIAGFSVFYGDILINILLVGYRDHNVHNYIFHYSMVNYSTGSKMCSCILFFLSLQYGSALDLVCFG
jgi:hypothetical protein